MTTTPPAPWIGATAEIAAAFLRARRDLFPHNPYAADLAAVSLIESAMTVRRHFDAEKIIDLVECILAGLREVSGDALRELSTPATTSPAGPDDDDPRGWRG